MTQEELLQAILEETRKNNSSSSSPSPTSPSRLPGAKEIDSALGAMKNSIAQGGGSISDFSRGVESLVPNIPLLKQLTGGGVMEARGLYQSARDIHILGTQILECNQRPAIKGRTDNALLRRIIDINFEMKFTSNKNLIET